MQFEQYKLNESFLEEYKEKKVDWGFGGLGEVAFYRTYSRTKEDGSKEQWWEVVQRVTEAIMSVYNGRLDAYNIDEIAKGMYDSIFHFKLMPSGRSLWALGTPIIEEKGLVEAISSCAFISTEGMTDSEPFEFMMDLSMVGVGLGFDVLGAGEVTIQEPQLTRGIYTIPDTREGWVESTRILLDAYLTGGDLPDFDYSEIRPEGEPIKTFGGIAPGPDPLIELHSSLSKMYDKHVGKEITGRMIVDTFTLIGKAVVSGNVRRTALLALLPEELADLKDYEKYPERKDHGWLANHSIYGSQIKDYEKIAENAMKNGEPGVVWVKKAQEYGRFADGKSPVRDKANGVNACSEMNLESKEYCLLSEIVLSRIDNLEEFIKIGKLSYFFGKAITEYLVHSRWEESAEVQRRNRRMGISLGGVAEFLGNNSLEDLVSWSDVVYTNLKNLDKEISDVLGISESIKMTTIKPSGTTSLLSGSSPGAHLVKSRYMIKRMRVSDNKKSLIDSLKESGVPHEPAVNERHSTVFEFAYEFDEDTLSYRNLFAPVQVQVAIVEALQEWWSDNSISVTVTIPTETDKDTIVDILKNRNLKTISFLPEITTYYPQMPLESVKKGEYEVKEVNLDYNKGEDAVGEKFCKDDVCEITDFVLNEEGRDAEMDEISNFEVVS